MRFKGRIVGDDEVHAMMKRAPAVYVRYFRAYLAYAGRVFVGTKTKDGALRSELAQKNAMRGGTWSRKFVNSVARFEIDKKKLTMRAGIIYSTQKKIHEIMELMESGYTRTNGGYMIVPNYKEITNKKPIGLFSQMLNAKMFRLIFKHGNIYYVNKNNDKLMFIGMKRISVKRQFNFDRTWNSVEPKITTKANKILQQATEAVERKENA